MIGVLVAAGRGRRMGGGKQLLPWTTSGGETKPLVAAAFDAVAGACDEMIVVTGHEADAVKKALGGRSFREVRADPDAEMSESVRAGLEAARRLSPVAAVLLHPGDHPEVGAVTLDALADALAEHEDRAVIPEYGKRGGHPVLIPPRLVETLVVADLAGGLRRYWLDHPEVCLRIPVHDPWVVRDVDHP